MTPLALASLALLPPAPTDAAPAPAAPPVAAFQEDGEGEEKELPDWSGSVSVGASQTFGNSENTTVAADGKVERRGEHDRLTSKAFWNYAEKSDDTSSNDRTDLRVGGGLEYDYFFTEKFYGLVQASGLYDREADLDLRWVAGFGAGYQFLEEEDRELGVEAGLSYVDEDYKGGVEDQYLAARVAYDTLWKLTESLDFEQSAEILPSLENSDDVVANLDTRLRLSMSESMFTQFQWVLTYDNTPAPGNERDDHLLLLTLGWEF